MIKAMRIWFDDYGATVYRETYEFDDLADLVAWLSKEELLEIFTSVVKISKTPDIVLSNGEYIVVIMKLSDASDRDNLIESIEKLSNRSG